MNNLVKSLMFNKLTAKLFLKSALKIHSLSYKVSGKLATILNDGVHPKKNIIKYNDWFVENIQDNDVILDVGSNTGMMSEMMCAKAAFVYGIEIQSKLVRDAKVTRQKDNNEFICADATIFDYANCRPIDCLTLSNVLEHIEHRVDFLKNIIKKVKWKDESNKKLLIRVPMIDREWIAVYKKELNIEYRLDTTHFTEYTFIKFSKEMKQSGISILNHHVVFGEIYAICKVS